MLPGGAVGKSVVVLGTQQLDDKQHGSMHYQQRPNREAETAVVEAETDTKAETPGQQVTTPRRTYEVDDSDTCVICMEFPREASINHGETGHWVCCLACAKELKRLGKSCPICRKEIDSVVRQFRG